MPDRPDPCGSAGQGGRPRLRFVSAALFAGQALLLGLSLPAPASSLTLSLTARIVSGPKQALGLTGTGQLRYDPNGLSGPGTLELSPGFGLLDVSLTLFEGTAYRQTFTAADDSGFDLFPVLRFGSSGVIPDPVSLDFLVVDGMPREILLPGIESIQAFEIEGLPGDNAFFLPLIATGDAVDLPSPATAPVPVPAAIAMMLAALSSLGLAARGPRHGRPNLGRARSIGAAVGAVILKRAKRVIIAACRTRLPQPAAISRQRLGWRKPTVSPTSAMTGSAIARARSAPSASTASMVAGSSIKRLSSVVIGPSTDTATSARAGLKVPKPWPACSRNTSSAGRPASAA